MKRFWPAIQNFFRRADLFLLTVCSLCAVLGIIVISSATASYGGTASYIAVQTLAFLLGVGLFLFFTVIDVDVFTDHWGLLVGLEAALMVLLLIFGESGDTVNRGWIRFLGIGIQPAEVVKVIYIVLMAKHMSFRREYNSLNSVPSVLQLVLHFGVMFAAIMVVSDDLGSALVFLFIFVVMLFMAGLRWYWILGGIGAAVAMIPVAWNHILRDDQKERILAPYFSAIDPEGVGVKWQTTWSTKALANGKFWGMGLGSGTVTQSDMLVGKHTDFIFAVIGEELGMLGCLVVLALLLCIILRCVWIGIRCKNTMNMLICFGVAATVLFQTFENMGMCLGISPVVGLTLPFFSYGGSSIFSLFAAMGLVSGIRYRPKPERFRSL